jgi:hypothetical protein
VGHAANISKMINSSEVFIFVWNLKGKNHVIDLGMDVQQHYDAPQGYRK